MRIGFSLAVMLVAVGACASGSRPSPEPTSAVPARILNDIVADAATRAGVGPADVTVVRAEARTWGDGSWGCPQPGMYYTQALVDGFQVIVSVDGRDYDYRGTGTRFRLCDNGAATP